jgi:hypothetical protein
MKATDQYSQDLIHRRLDASQEAVEAALMVIYDRQTAEERAGAYARETNGVGFSKFDAEFCTSLVEQLKRGKKLTPKQLEVARRKMKRYWRQLVTCMTTEPPPPAPETFVPAVRVVAGKPAVPTVMELEAAQEFGTW